MPDPRAAARPLLGIALGALASAFAAALLGEHEIELGLGLAAGAVVGLAVGEVVVWAGRSRHVLVGLAAGVAAAGGMVWAGWIDSSKGLEPVKAGAWAGAALAGALALVRVSGLRRPRRRASG